MLKLLIDFGNAPPKTGIGNYASSLLNAVNTYLPDKVSACEAEVSWIGRSFRPLKRLAYLHRLRQLRHRGFNGADVVHFMNVYTPPRFQGVGYVGSIADLDPIMMTEAHTRRYTLYFKSMTAKTVDRSDVVSVISESVRSEVIDYYDVDPDRVMVGGIGLSLEFMRRADEEPTVFPDLPTLLYVGQLNKKKNTAWLIRTIRQGVKRGALPKLKLVLAGRTGYGFEDVKHELHSAGDMAEWIQFPSIEEIVRLYASCSAFIFPSEREGFGIPLLEAMYCGKPVVASRIPASMEVGGEAALFFDLENSEELFEMVLAALREPDHPERTKAAKANLKKYSWEHLAHDYLNIYERAIERSILQWQEPSQ